MTYFRQIGYSYHVAQIRYECDVLIIGAGIVGLSVGIALLEANPHLINWKYFLNFYYKLIAKSRRKFTPEPFV